MDDSSADFAVAVVRRWDDGGRQLIRIMIGHGSDPDEGDSGQGFVTASIDEALDHLAEFLGAPARRGGSGAGRPGRGLGDLSSSPDRLAEW